MIAFVGSMMSANKKGNNPSQVRARWPLDELKKMKDIIYIKDLRVKTIIGIFDWERKVKQEVSIDMEFPFDCKRQQQQIL